MNFGQALKEMRQAKHLGVNQLALKSGVSASQISRFENGASKNPTTDTIKKLAKALNDDDQELMQKAGYLLPPKNLKVTPTANGAIVTADSSTPEWANESDVLELHDFLTSNAGMAFEGVKLTKEQKQRVNEILTQVFWEEIKKEKDKKSD